MTPTNPDSLPRPALRFRLEMAPLSQSGQWAPVPRRRQAYHSETLLSDVIGELQSIKRVLRPAQYVAADGLWCKGETSTLMPPDNLEPVITSLSHNSPIIVELLGSSVLVGLVVWSLKNSDKIGRFIPDPISHWRKAMLDLEITTQDIKRRRDALPKADRQLRSIGVPPEDDAGDEVVPGTAVADAMTKAVDKFRLDGGFGEIIRTNESQQYLKDVRYVQDAQDFDDWTENWD